MDRNISDKYMLLNYTFLSFIVDFTLYHNIQQTVALEIFVIKMQVICN